MRLHLAAVLLIGSPSFALAQPSAADKAAEAQTVADATKRLCEQLVDCQRAKFRYGKIVQYQGKYLACGEVEPPDAEGGEAGYQVWMVLVGSSAAPMLESSFPKPTREAIHAGPCSQPTTQEMSNPTTPEPVAQKRPTAADAPTAAKSSTDKQLIRAFETCIAANTRTEFDRANDVVTRISTSCQLAGVKRIRGRNDPVYQDSLVYDADAQQLSWIVPVTLGENSMSGTVASPYNGAERDQLSRHDRSVLDGLQETDFKLMEVTDAGDAAAETYDAQNAFGAKTTVTTGSATVYSIAVPTQSDSFKAIPLFRATMANDVARDLVPNLDVEFDWQAQQPCAICLKAGTIEEGIPGPTFDRPYSFQILHKYVFARITNIKLIDRRNGATIANGPSNDVSN